MAQEEELVNLSKMAMIEHFTDWAVLEENPILKHYKPHVWDELCLKFKNNHPEWLENNKT